MLIARKLTSAMRLYRRQGIPGIEQTARIRATALFRSHRPIPADPARRARSLSAMLNRWSGFSTLVASHGRDEVREALLIPYLRYRFAEVVAAVDEKGFEPSLAPLEVVVLADCLNELWEYRRIEASLPAWIAAVDGTAFARRIRQVGRRAALRTGRLTVAARGIDGDGDDLPSLVLRGEVYDALGRMEEAGAVLAAAVQRDGSNSYARQIFGFHLLKSGRTLEGLSNWSAADTLAGLYPLRRYRPSWSGEPLGSRHLMIMFEHGLGDMIQMSRFLPRLRAREPLATITGRIPAPLAGLLARSFPTITFVTEDEQEPDYDLFVPSMQLPAVLVAHDLEPRNRYIDLLPAAPDAPPRPERGSRCRIGICWRGHPRQYDLTRSVPLPVFARLFQVPDTDFVVLLNSLTSQEASALADLERVSVPQIRDFVDLAAEIASCDLVVSVDTAVPHLAAAGGVPVLMLSRPDACWRWGVSGRSEWYEAVEVLRHGGDMDWPKVLDEAAARIRRLGADAMVRGAGS